MSEIGLHEAMRTLRAVRRLRPDPVPDDVLRRVLDAACQAPTGGNRQPFRIVVVRNRAKLTSLGRLYAEAWYAYVETYRELTKSAPEPVRAEGEKMLTSGNHLADHFGETPVLLVFCFDPRQMAITDAGLARVSVVGGASIYPPVQNALLACRAEGLGCPDHPVMRLRCRSARSPRDPRAVGHRRGDPDRLAAAAWPRPDFAAPARSDRLRGHLEEPLACGTGGLAVVAK